MTDDNVIRNFSIAALSTGRRPVAFTIESTQKFGNIVVGKLTVPDILNVRLVECGETNAKGLAFARLWKRKNEVWIVVMTEYLLVENINCRIIRPSWEKVKAIVDCCPHACSLSTAME